jgi:hypothetical protein
VTKPRIDLLGASGMVGQDERTGGSRIGEPGIKRASETIPPVLRNVVVQVELPVPSVDIDGSESDSILRA